MKEREKADVNSFDLPKKFKRTQKHSFESFVYPPFFACIMKDSFKQEQAIQSNSRLTTTKTKHRPLKHKRRYCKVAGCTKIVKSQGLCQRHGARSTKCKIPACPKQAQGNHNGMCKAHDRQCRIAMEKSKNPNGIFVHPLLLAPQQPQVMTLPESEAYLNFKNKDQQLVVEHVQHEKSLESQNGAPPTTTTTVFQEQQPKGGARAPLCQPILPSIHNKVSTTTTTTATKPVLSLALPTIKPIAETKDEKIQVKQEDYQDWDDPLYYLEQPQESLENNQTNQFNNEELVLDLLWTADEQQQQQQQQQQVPPPPLTQPPPPSMATSAIVRQQKPCTILDHFDHGNTQPRRDSPRTTATRPRSLMMI